jgi:hypothetical protein
MKKWLIVGNGGGPHDGLVEGEPGFRHRVKWVGASFAPKPNWTTLTGTLRVLFGGVEAWSQPFTGGAEFNVNLLAADGASVRVVCEAAVVRAHGESEPA